MTWTEMLYCERPDVKEQTLTVVVDFVMILISSCCLILTVYGTYRYIIDHQALAHVAIKPAKPLYFGGLIFFVVSSIVLLTALLYDLTYLLCPRLDEIEGPIYHGLYFFQIFCLWIVLFLRIYYIFQNSPFTLSKWIIRGYVTAFIMAFSSIFPIYFLFQLEADSWIALPYVTMSAVFSTAILVMFVGKLMQIFKSLGADELLLKTMVKNTILATISISCTFLVVIVLVGLSIKHSGDHKKHSVLEELLLELFILLDIVSNFVCILLGYSFFDKKFQRVCGRINDKIVDFTSKKISSSRSKSNGSRGNNYKTEITLDLETTHATTTVNKSRVNSVSKIDEVGELQNYQSEHSKSKSKSGHSMAAELVLRLSNKLSNSQNNDNDITTVLMEGSPGPTLEYRNSNTMPMQYNEKKKIMSLRATKSQPIPKRIVSSKMS